MNNNYVLRRIRYIFDFNDSKMMALFASTDHPVTRAQVSNWLKKEEEPDFEPLEDRQLAIFLNGLINDKRGKREWPPNQPEAMLNNNIILRKLKIALNLIDEDMLKIFELARMRVSKHELSAFFRKPDQKQYRLCQDQFLRNFLHGLQVKYRGDAIGK